MISESIFQEIASDVWARLQHLDPALTYHTSQHTLQVMQDAAYLFFAERNRKYADLYLLKTAALLHDTGFLSTYEGHEEESCELAADILETHGLDEEVIAGVQDLIMATRIPQNPKTLLAEILCDADLYYLGTNKFEPTAQLLYKEWKHYGIVNSMKEFDKVQIRFLESHHYFTQSARESLEGKKQKHLEQIKRRLHNL